MSKPLQIKITESVSELRKLQSQHVGLINNRLLMLIEIKNHEKEGISKRDLSLFTGINHNSIIKWRKMYMQFGIEPLLSHGRVSGFKKAVFSIEEHKKLEQLLTNPKNGIKGYTALLAWVAKELSKDIKYITLLKYTERHFKSKIKVTRKNLVKKEEILVDIFNKPLMKSAIN